MSRYRYRWTFEKPTGETVEEDVVHRAQSSLTGWRGATRWAVEKARHEGWILLSVEYLGIEVTA